MSLWPKRPEKGKRRPKLTAQPPPSQPTPTQPKPATPAPPLKKRSVKFGATKPAAAKPARKWSVTLGSGSLLAALFLMFMLLAWGAGMSLVLIFGDKLSARLIAQNSEMQDAYEQRLQAYRDEIARVVSEAEQNKVDKDSVTGRVIELTRRQRAIETRLNVLNKSSDQIGVGPGGAPPVAGGAPAASETPLPPPRPGFPTRPGQTRGDVEIPMGAQWALAAPEPMADAPMLHPAATSDNTRTDVAQLLDPPTFDQAPTQQEIELEAQVGRLERALVQVELAQTRALAGMVRLSDQRLNRFRAALTIVGLTPEGLAPETGRPVNALPGLVLPLSEQNTPFGQQINQIRGHVALLHRLRAPLQAMPMERPTPVEGVRLASPFGFRIHPISGGRKLHAGLDLAGAAGTPIRAAGSGIVLSSGWGGGYGNLVQIDHGNGVISRYAHLSAIDVAQGQPIAAGAIVGRMGTTGASTGNHLHFETRLKSGPANPACFLMAGDRLKDASTPGLVCDKPPFGQDSSSSEDEDDDS